MKTIYVLVGPTSTGKTTLALQLAKEFNGEVISADSRQIYKYMDVGTGKLPIDASHDIQRKDKHWVIDGINIWGYDLVEPDKYFSAYDFADFALKKAQELLEQGKTVFLVGGTGLYIDIFMGNVSVAQVDPNLELRNELEKLSMDELISKLTSLNAERAENIDKSNKMRIIRAIEVASSKSKNTTPLPYLTDTNFIFIGLTADRTTLYSRADAWLDRIWTAGLKLEVQNLIDSGYKDSPKLHGLIYKSVLDCINKKSTEVEAIQRAKFDLHAYIRRQQTWFKRNNSIKWFDVTQENFSQNVKACVIAIDKHL